MTDIEAVYAVAQIEAGLVNLGLAQETIFHLTHRLSAIGSCMLHPEFHEFPRRWIRKAAWIQ